MAFNWNTYRAQRLASAVRAYNSAITNKVKELQKEGRYTEANVILENHPKVKTSEIKEMIHSVSDFRRLVGYKNDKYKGRPSELDRVLKSVNPKALEVVYDTSTDAFTTQYSVSQMKRSERILRKRKKHELEDLQTKLHDADQSFDIFNMSQAELGTLLNNTDLLEGGEYDDLFGTKGGSLQRRVDLLNEIYFGSIDAKFDEYVKIWENPVHKHAELGGYNLLLDILTWLKNNKPWTLNKEFNMGADEVSPEYLLSSGGPYQNIDFETRHNRALNYWTRVAAANGYYNERINNGEAEAVAREVGRAVQLGNSILSYADEFYDELKKYPKEYQIYYETMIKPTGGASQEDVNRWNEITARLQREYEVWQEIMRNKYE